MASFKDSQDKTWPIDLTIADVARVRTMCNVDLLDPTGTPESPGAQEKLQSDLVTICEVIACVCEPQRQREDVSKDDFMSSCLRGKSLRNAVKAFWEAWSDFFREVGREDMAEVVKGTYEMTVASAQAAAEKVKELMPKLHMQQLLDQQQEMTKLERSLSKGSGPVGTSSGTDPE